MRRKSLHKKMITNTKEGFSKNAIAGETYIETNGIGVSNDLASRAFDHNFPWVKSETKLWHKLCTAKKVLDKNSSVEFVTSDSEQIC